MSRRALVTLLILSIVATLVACKKAPVAPPSSMIGHWEGKADISVNWCRATELPVTLVVDEKGSVTGKFGDATLKDAHIYPNPGQATKKFMLATKYVIEAELVGPLVASEEISRPDICIPVEVTGDGRLAGAFLTSGSETGARRDGVFSGGLRPLTKTQAR